MKKTMFSLLMLAAMFMVASCGSKSNSGEATEATQEEVTFTDPALVYSGGLDLTSYFSAENLTKPGLWKDSDGYYHLSTNVKLKLLKKLNVVREREYGLIPKIYFKIKFCDENGSTIESGSQYKDLEDIVNMSEGTVIAVDVKSDGEFGEYEGKELLEKVAKIEVSTSTENLKFAEATDSIE